MPNIFERHPYISICVVVLILASIVLQMIIGSVLGKMVQEAENLSSTENKQLKQCKLKFVNCYKMNEGVENVTVFVERFLERLEVGKFKLTMLHRMSGQLLLLAVLLSGLGAAYGIVEGETVGQLLPFYVMAFLGLYLYFVASGFAGLEEKKLSLKFSLVDYLENHTIARLKQADEVLNQKLDGMEVPLVPEKEILPDKNVGSIFSEKEKRELEMLLREFLT